MLSTVKTYDDPRLSHVSSWGAKKLAQQRDSHQTFLADFLDSRGGAPNCGLYRKGSM